jgi:hypothetical protein
MKPTLFIVALFAIAPTQGQWFGLKTPGAPRNADGKVNLTAPAPKTADGKPDLSGVWMSDTVKYLMNLAADLKPEQVPFQPWAKALYEERLAEHGIHDPEARCLPQGTPKMSTLPWPFKIFSVPGETVILYETNGLWRQIFTDGRALPKDPSPTWLGYSVGRWDGDAFVVDSNGLGEKMWFDTNGHPHTEALHVTEKFRRPDFGHMNIEITIDDPKAYTKPWSATVTTHFVPDTELLEFVCDERSMPHMVGK